MQYFDIAGIKVCLKGYDLSALDGQFLQFSCPPLDEVDVCIKFVKERAKPFFGQALHDDVVNWQRVLHYGDRIVFDLGNEHLVQQVVLSADYSDIVLYFDPALFGLARHKEDVEIILHNFLYWGVMGYVTCRDGLMLHSASIVYRDEAIAFSAVSGTGKSTQAGLWQERYKVKILDGDLNAVRLKGDDVRLYGLPWCGTSGQCLNESAPLRAIIFLEQADQNSIEKLSATEAVLRLAARSRLPQWDRELMSGAFLQTAETIAFRTECYLLKCLPDYGAVELVKECLDRNRER